MVVYKMKIKIMVLSSTLEPYNKLMQAQKDTWDSIEHKDISTVFYYGDQLPDGVSPGDKRDLPVNCSNDYNMMHWKFKLALNEVLKEDWDYIFKTNSSSYIDKHNLYIKALTLPIKECYCGLMAVDLLLVQVHLLVETYVFIYQKQLHHKNMVLKMFVLVNY